MRWIPDATGAEWLAERLDDATQTMHVVVPRGFEAYARVFHPIGVRSIPGRAMPTFDELDRLSPAERQQLIDQFIDTPARWADAAAAFGTTMHPLAQWHRLVRATIDDAHSRLAPDGREFEAPAIGALSPDHLSTLAAHLVQATTTADDGFAAVWEGFGGLVGFMGHSPSRGFYTFSDDPNHQAMLDRSIHNPLNNLFRKKKWQEGILSREISEGPRLRLPLRDHVLFSAAPRVFADPAWVLDAPWRDRIAESHGFPPSAQHPNIIWPADRAWVMVSEIDFNSTVVAGSAELVRAICDDPELEASPLSEGAALHWEADEVNE